MCVGVRVCVCDAVHLLHAVEGAESGSPRGAELCPRLLPSPGRTHTLVERHTHVQTLTHLEDINGSNSSGIYKQREHTICTRNIKMCLTPK